MKIVLELTLEILLFCLFIGLVIGGIGGGLSLIIFIFEDFENFRKFLRKYFSWIIGSIVFTGIFFLILPPLFIQPFNIYRALIFYIVIFLIIFSGAIFAWMADQFAEEITEEKSNNSRKTIMIISFSLFLISFFYCFILRPTEDNKFFELGIVNMIASGSCFITSIIIEKYRIRQKRQGKEVIIMEEREDVFSVENRQVMVPKIFDLEKIKMDLERYAGDENKNVLTFYISSILQRFKGAQQQKNIHQLIKSIKIKKEILDEVFNYAYGIKKAELKWEKLPLEDEIEKREMEIRLKEIELEKERIEAKIRELRSPKEPPVIEGIEKIKKETEVYKWWFREKRRMKEEGYSDEEIDQMERSLFEKGLL